MTAQGPNSRRRQGEISGGAGDFFVFLLILYLFLGWVPAVMCFAVSASSNSVVTGYVGEGLLALWGLTFLTIMVLVSDD